MEALSTRKREISQWILKFYNVSHHYEKVCITDWLWKLVQQVKETREFLNFFHKYVKQEFDLIRHGKEEVKKKSVDRGNLDNSGFCLLTVRTTLHQFQSAY